jgi:hypothetical protein
MHLSGEKIKSKVVFDPADEPVAGLPPASSADIGVREVRSRFPQMGAAPSDVFGNDPRNLFTAEKLRNPKDGDKAVGGWEPSMTEKKHLGVVTATLIKHVFTRKNIRRAMIEYEEVVNHLPKKMSAEARQKCYEDLLAETPEGGTDPKEYKLSVLMDFIKQESKGKPELQVGIIPPKPHVKNYSNLVDAFVKAEATSKPKPRAISNHGFKRLAAMAKVAFVFEHVMFHALEKMSIKHYEKKTVLKRIARSLNTLDGKLVENDLTAFEFGIGKHMKECEMLILDHIAKEVGVHEEGVMFYRVMNDRNKRMTWSMRYKDETGEFRVFKLRLRNVIRDSGDRLTSSGNFLLNLIIWLFVLVIEEETYVEEAVKTLVRTKGVEFFYVSKRDGKTYCARLRFEGDDTAGKLQEALVDGFAEKIQKAFRDIRWCPKFKFVENEGTNFLRFVGWDMLVRDGQVVFEGTGQNAEPVMFPEVKRLLTTKQWTTFQGTDEEMAECQRVYACVMAEAFKYCEPMHAFMSSMHRDSLERRRSVVDDTRMIDLHLLATGEMPNRECTGLSQVELPGGEGGARDHNWRELCRVTAGEFSAQEWAGMCGLTTLRLHGADLATIVPRSWVT